MVYLYSIKNLSNKKQMQQKKTRTHCPGQPSYPIPYV